MDMSLINVISPFLWPIYLPISLSQTHALQILSVFLLVVGIICGLKAKRLLAKRFLISVTLLFIPLLQGQFYFPIEKITLRYFVLASIFLIFFGVWGAAALFQIANRTGKAIGLILLVMLMAIECYYSFSPDEQLTFQQEYRFLRDELPKLPKNSTVCFFDPNVNHTWPGSHNDLDAAFYFPEDGNPYYGIPITARRLGTKPASPSHCDYYYESALCSLDFSDEHCVAFDLWRDDIQRYQAECRVYRHELGKAIVAERWAQQHVYWSMFNDKEGAPIPLRLYAAHSEVHDELAPH